MVKMTCLCGSTTQTFQRLTKAAFPHGWTAPCCKSTEVFNGAEIHEPSKEKPLIEMWLDSCNLRNQTRNGIWVLSSKCYEHFVTWLKAHGFQHKAPNPVRFGIDMSRICTKRRRNRGQCYLLEKDLNALRA